jgi:hypothetical protein
MELQQNTQPSRELSSQLVSIMTTEHYNLQTGRAMTVSEANGRASLFVGAVSSGLIALALVAQLSHLGTAFFVFSLVVLPTLFFMGLITFQRVLQSGLADVTYARGINRIRHLYLEYAPKCSRTSFLDRMMMRKRRSSRSRCSPPGCRASSRWRAWSLSSRACSPAAFLACCSSCSHSLCGHVSLRESLDFW